MKHSQSEETSKQYSRISFETRKDLIRLVEEEHCSIAQAGSALDIKNSTAKLIISKYRKEGRIFIRKSEAKEERNRKKTKGKPKRQVEVVEPKQLPQTPTIVETPQPTQAQNVFPGQFQPFQFVYFVSWPPCQQMGGDFPDSL